MVAARTSRSRRSRVSLTPRTVVGDGDALGRSIDAPLARFVRATTIVLELQERQAASKLQERQAASKLQERQAASKLQECRQFIAEQENSTTQQESTGALRTMQEKQAAEGNREP